MGKVTNATKEYLNHNKYLVLIVHCSRAILSYLVAAYAKTDELYPTDIRVRALVDQRLHFDLGTLYQRLTDFYVSG